MTPSLSISSLSQAPQAETLGYFGMCTFRPPMLLCHSGFVLPNDSTAKSHLYVFSMNGTCLGIKYLMIPGLAIAEFGVVRSSAFTDTVPPTDCQESIDTVRAVVFKTRFTGDVPLLGTLLVAATLHYL